jgi:hypothetical protein
VRCRAQPSRAVEIVRRPSTRPHGPVASTHVSSVAVGHRSAGASSGVFGVSYAVCSGTFRPERAASRLALPGERCRPFAATPPLSPAAQGAARQLAQRASPPTPSAAAQPENGVRRFQRKVSDIRALAPLHEARGGLSGGEGRKLVGGAKRRASTRTTDSARVGARCVATSGVRDETCVEHAPFSRSLSCAGLHTAGGSASFEGAPKPHGVGAVLGARVKRPVPAIPPQRA